MRLRQRGEKGLEGVRRGEQGAVQSGPGYKKLIVWQNAHRLRRLVYELAQGLPKTELRRVSQMRDAARSVKQNIQEGYTRSLPVYIHYLQIARGSLAELRGDVEDCADDRLITKEQFLEADELSGKTEYLFKRLIQSLINKRDGHA